MTEKLIKSKQRVKDFAEVYTPSWIVKDMLDLIPDITIDKTFLEPSCGNGAFITEILRRKFDLCKTKKDYIRAIESVYGIEIQFDNCLECRQRIKDLYVSYGQKLTKDIELLVDKHIIHGDALAIMELLAKDNEDKVNIIVTRKLEEMLKVKIELEKECGLR